jgi:hypothetical protein
MSVAVSHTHASPQQAAQAPRRRVRQEARDALAVAAFSAGASTSLAVVLTVVVTRVG